MPHQDVMTPDEEGLLELAVAIADGTPIDWAASTPSPANAASTSVLVRLQCLERLVRGHEAVRTRPEPRKAASAHDTLLTEARRKTGLRPGQPLQVQWGPLIVYEKIGRGSFGDVYRARDPRLDREVALKLVPEDTTESVSSPVVEEGRLLARIRHPNVLAVYGAERIDGRVGIWTEYIRGETVADEIARRGPLSPDEAARIGIDVCRALGAVHEAGLLHRDVKAQNILRDATGRLVLGDFGTGVERDEHAGVAEPQIAGTPLYLAPEVFEGQAATVGSDLYSAGVLLYFLVTAKFPVRGGTFAEIRRAHATGQRVLLRDARPDLPAPFVDVVDALLATGPDRRYGTAAAAERALGAWVEKTTEPEAAVERALEIEATTRYGSAGEMGATSAALSATVTTRARWWAKGVLIALLVVLAALTAVPLVRSARSPGRAPEIAVRPSPSPPPTSVSPSPPQSVSPPPPTEIPFAVLNFHARDWVLIAAFENRTGEAILDGTLEFALERELSNSAFVNVVPRERIDDVLALMRRPIDTKVDARVARELAVRDGGIRTVVTGRVEKIGSAYVLTSQIVHPGDGTVVKSLSEDASEQAGLQAAVRRQALRMRETLGEMLPTIRSSQMALERVTTPSLHALQLYSQAAAFMGGDDSSRWKNEPAEQLLTQAVSEDPDFASAHILLAFAVRNQGRPKEDFLPSASRAVQLADRTSDVERYFILGSGHSLRARALGPGEEADGARRQAIAAYEALTRIKPDHVWAVGNLVNLYISFRQEPEATNMLTRLADLRPTNLPQRWLLAQRFFRQGDRERGWGQIRRAQKLLTPEFAKEHPEYGAQIQQIQVGEAWMRQDVKRVRELTDDVARRMEVADAGNPAVRSIRLDLVGIYNALGRLGDARRAAENLPPDVRDEYIVRVLHGEAIDGKPGAKDALRRHLLTMYPSFETIPANPLFSSSLVLVGELDAFRAAVARARRDGYVLYRGSPSRWFAQTAEARLALAEGRIEDAVRFFQSGSEMGAPPTNSVATVSMLAAAWMARGEVDRARTMLEEATRERWPNSVVASTAWAGFGVSVNDWMRARERLADVYRATGRVQEAVAIDAEILPLLAAADDDHPILLRLKARRTANPPK